MRLKFYLGGSIIVCLFIIIFSIIYYYHKTKTINALSNLEFGVNIHFTGSQNDIKLIKDAGIKVVRMDMFWSAIEKQKGHYDFQESGYDDLTNSLIKNGIRPYYILDYSNSLYEKNNTITTEKGLIAFNKFVEHAVSRYKNKHIIWEIWNEPNGNGWETKPNYDQYANLVKSVSKVIKKNDPTATVVAPALASVDKSSLAWLNEIIKRGTIKYIDALSVHPYRGQVPETVGQDYESLRKIIANYSKKNIPIISGEWGYPVINNWNGTSISISEQDQAKYVVRIFLTNIYNKIPISIWYDWKNDGMDFNNPEQNFGLRESDVSIPKLSYFAIKTLTNILSGFNFDKRYNIGSNQDYVLSFNKKSGDRVLVCWTTNQDHSIRLPVNFKGKVLSIYGENIGTFNKDTNKINITDSPIYLLEKNH